MKDLQDIVEGLQVENLAVVSLVQEIHLRALRIWSVDDQWTLATHWMM